MPSDSEKRRFSWRGFRKISAKLPILHAFRHVCGIGGHTRTEKCLWRFSLQMHCNVKARKSSIISKVNRPGPAQAGAPLNFHKPSFLIIQGILWSQPTFGSYSYMKKPFGSVQDSNQLLLLLRRHVNH